MGAEHLVTGGAGFIGSNLVRRLAGEGVRVRVFDNLSSGRRENLEGLGSAVEFAEGDLRDAAAVREAMRGIRRVFHLGALASVQASVDDPATT
ncbi:MAG: SDR family NAD(P)-dependent oxidoreductase, partial [Kiritimatiellae bacterium]|nr:SDR family NAD(P)-dependent oxidoreductase [Kiritimatiellia bacterium]